MLYAGQDDNFKEAESGLEKYLRIPVNNSQIERLCKTYGGLLEDKTEELSLSLEQSSLDLRNKVKEEGVAYAMLDGCMILSREPKDEKKGKKQRALKPASSQAETSSLSVIKEEDKALNIEQISKVEPPESETIDCQIIDNQSIKSNEIKSKLELNPEQKLKEQETAPTHTANADKQGDDIFPKVLNSSWREMKVGRIFIEPDRYEIGRNRNWIRESLFCAHFGIARDFTDKFEAVLDPFDVLGKRLVFINDGAQWIWTWVSETYPNAIQILDCFHANEYISDFAKIYFKNETKRLAWDKLQKERLQADKVDQVIETIEQLEAKIKVRKDAKTKILSYFTNNRHRMLYKTFREQGLLIGSGAIESAHRFVIQKRMKQSGQRWTRKGGQKVANLRVAHLNNQWGKVVKLIDNQSIAA